MSSCHAESGPNVLLLAFSRSSQSFREVLLQAPELADCRQALANNGYQLEHSSGAKIFVQPQHYEPLMEAISSIGLKLAPRHIFVAPALEQAVMKALHRAVQHPKCRVAPDCGIASPMSRDVAQLRQKTWFRFTNVPRCGTTQAENKISQTEQRRFRRKFIRRRRIRKLIPET